MAKQTGSIGLAASNSVKLYAEAGFDSIEQNYYSKSDFTISPSQITSKITELTNSTGSLIQRTNTLEQTVTGITQVLEGKVDSDEPWVSWLHAGADETTHEPYLAMGQDSDYPSVKYTGSAAKFYNGQGNSDSNIVAQFGANGALIGRVGEAHTSISSDKTIFYGADGLEAANISMSAPGTTIARATYSIIANGTTTVSKTITNILPMPDFTLGEMASYGNMQLTITINDVMVGAYNISSLTDPVSSPHSGNYTTSFQASQGTEGWNFMMEVQGTTNEDTDEIVYHLEWLYSGSGPMFNFGTAMMSGAYAFSVGNGNVVTQENSVALGLGLITNSPAQIVVGKYNKPEKWASFIVGNGFNDTSRSNAFWIDNQGTAHIKGFIQDSNTPVLALSTEAKQNWQTTLGITKGTTSNNYGTWHWTKIDDLVIAQWRSLEKTVSSSSGWTQWGSLWYYGFGSLNFPFTFSTAPEVSLTFTNTGGTTLMPMFDGITTTKINNIYMWRVNTISVSGFYLCLTVTGRVSS